MDFGSGTLTETGSAGSGELDLYEELANFSALSPEEQRKELKRVESAKAQPAVTVDDSPSAGFDYIELGELPPCAEGGLEQSSEPLSNPVDEAQFEPPGQRPSSASPEPLFTFSEEPVRESSQSSQASHLVCRSDDPFDEASPLEGICAEALLGAQTTMKCESCGATSNLEDLFCPSCSQLLNDETS